MHICICDDDIGAMEAIRDCMEPCISYLTRPSITCVASLEEFLAQFEKDKYEMIFMDIAVGDGNGVDAIRQIRRVDDKVIVVFISSYQEYVFETFEVEPLQFLVKPVTPEAFHKVFQRAMLKYRKLYSKVTLKWQGEQNVIRIGDIKYVEGYSRHLRVATVDGVYETVGKIPDMFRTLEPHGFVQVHQGFLVNMHYIKHFAKKEVVLKDNSRIEVSVRRRTPAIRKLQEYMQETEKDS
ncbi:MAG: LytTR family DNA-binding domain-containing protein [Clostridiales bacterium]|nr:LytTR family DNA-binding domain-containing protein [Clostridiales bacterium]